MPLLPQNEHFLVALFIDDGILGHAPFRFRQFLTQGGNGLDLVGSAGMSCVKVQGNDPAWTNIVQKTADRLHAGFDFSGDFSIAARQIAEVEHAGLEPAQARLRQVFGQLFMPVQAELAPVGHAGGLQTRHGLFQRTFLHVKCKHFPGIPHQIHQKQGVMAIAGGTVQCPIAGLDRLSHECPR